MKKYVTIAVLLLVAAITFQTILLVNTSNLITNKAEFSAKAVLGSATLCINRPAQIEFDCAAAFNQSTRIEDWTQNCQFNITHPFDAQIYTDIFIFPDVLNVSWDNQTFEINITGFQEAVGNHTLQFEVWDLGPCPITQFYNYTFEILDINDPPELITEIPSIEIRQGQTVSAYFLNNYFMDPDGDPLTYNRTLTHSRMRITIHENTSEVRITNPANQCSDEVVYFTATDPYNLSADSNMVELFAICEAQAQDASAGGMGAESAPPCRPQWQCGSWSQCLQNGSRYRDCRDMNACDIDNLQRRFWEECEYQEIPGEQPEESQESLEELEEEELREETPRPQIFPEEQDNFMTYILVSIFTASMLAAAYLLFRKQIRSLYAKIMWKLTIKQRQELLLKDKEKTELLKLIANFEIKIQIDKNYLTNSQIIQELLKIYRMYFSYALNISQEFKISETTKPIQKLVHEDLKKAFELTLKRILSLERSKISISSTYLRALVQQLRYYVFATANIYKSDINFKIKPISAEGSHSNKIITQIHNSYSALEFKEFEEAKKLYLMTLEEYEKLSESKKPSLNTEIAQLYHNIKYMISWNKKW